MTRQARRTSVRSALGVALPATIAVLVVAIVALHAFNRSSPISTWWFGNAFMAFNLAMVGAVLVRRVPDNRIGWLFLAGALAQAVVGTGREWAVYVVVGSHDLPGATLGAWLGTWLFVVALMTFPLTLLLFPDGRLPSPRWRPVLWAILAFLAMGMARLVTVPGPFADELPGLVNPLGIDWTPLDVIGTVGQLGLTVSVVLALAALIVRMRRAEPELRQQLRWVVAGGVILGVEVLAEMLPSTGDAGIFAVTGPLAMALFVASIAVAVLRYRLWDLDLVIRWSIVYGILTALVATAYLALVAAAGNIEGAKIHLGWSVLVAAVTVAVFTMARDRVQQLVERLFFGDRRDPYRALARLGERLDQPTSIDGVLDEVVDAVAQALRLDHVALSVPVRGVVASTGVPRLGATDLPLLFRGRQVGTMAVVPRHGHHIGAAEETLLADLARPVAAVLEAVSAGEEAQRSRQELVTAREAERRRVRRDLHDGLGPALAAVRMKLDSATVLVDRDPEAAKAVLVGLTDDLRTTIDDVRRLVYDLQPPVLAEIGLLAALRQQGRAFTGPRPDGGWLDVQVAGPEAIDGLSAAVEVAAYRIVGEGLANVARHAHADHCWVTLSMQGGLDVRIDDDGVGLTGHEVPGVGTSSMVERAEELGGTCRIGPSPFGGTQVSGHLPVDLADPVQHCDRPVEGEHVRRG